MNKIIEWLYEAHKQHLVIFPTESGTFAYKWIDCSGKIEEPPYNSVSDFVYETPEKAKEDAVKEFIHLLISKQQ